MKRKADPGRDRRITLRTSFPDQFNAMLSDYPSARLAGSGGGGNGIGRSPAF